MDWRLILLLLCCGCHAQHSIQLQGIQNVRIAGDKIYVGGTNHLSVITSDDLSLLASATTGPVQDSPLCSADAQSCLKDARLTQTDNANKVLVVLKGGILACGSVRQGMCRLHSTDNVNQSEPVDSTAVASNDPAASTVALQLDDERVLVASTHTFDSPYRETHPAVAMRYINDMQVVNSGSLEGEAAVFLRAEFRNNFKVRYVHSFSHGRFAYVVAVQPARLRAGGLAAPPVTRLIRVCRDDDRFASYSEIELQCRAEDNSNLNAATAAVLAGDQLVVAFGTADSMDTNATLSSLKQQRRGLARRGGICVFDMARLKLTFWYNIDRCRGGTDSIGLPHVGRDSKCINKSRIPLDEETCELGVGGSIEQVEVVSVEVPAQITSLAAAASPPILLVGTDQAEIIQYKTSTVSPKFTGPLVEYTRRQVSGPGAVRSLHILGDRILAATETELSTLPLASCQPLASCSECLTSTDPLCGWCHARGECSIAASCPSAISLCPLGNVAPSPAQWPAGKKGNVTVTIDHLPQPTGYNYECLFGASITRAIPSADGVVCPVPGGVATNDTGLVTLSVRTSQSIHSIIQHNFTLFDCGQFSTCASCSSSSKWECEWCGGKCNAPSLCPATASSSSRCARITPALHPIAVSLAAPAVNVTLPVENMDGADGYTCRLDGKTAPARVVGAGSVRCVGLPSPAPPQSGNSTRSVELWRGREKVDETRVLFYSCQHLGRDCSSCSALPPHLGCGWCSGRCADACHKHAPCDKPVILKFSPSSGPTAGGTVLHISGRDLGSSREQVEDRVWVGQTRCRVVEYNVSTGVACRLEKGTGSGPVRIAIGKNTAESSEFYQFVNVSLFSIHPAFGPVAGGTRMVVYGKNLHAGSAARLFIGDDDTRECTVMERNLSASLSCLTAASPSLTSPTVVRLLVDGAETRLERAFQYRPDPAVHSIYPLTAFKSGGRTLTVMGQHFDSALTARMYLLTGAHASPELASELGDCQIHNATVMTCLSPRVKPALAAASAFTRWNIGLAIDNVKSLRNVGPRLQLTIVPDPTFEPFPGIRAHHGDQPLILDGRFLNQAAEPRDYKIWIGSERCYVTLVDSRQLVCAGPTAQPEGTDENGDKLPGGLPVVSVQVGHVRQQLGLISYSDEGAARRLWMAVASCAAALILVLAILLFVWRRRHSERERDYKKVQLQMEHLESNVRRECKQAFAELQTSMSFYGGAPADPPPMVSPRDFLDRLLWQDVQATGTGTALYAATLPVTLAQFDALLSSKPFVFALVSAAEADPHVGPAERNTLASLIVTVLLRNLQYLSEIVFELMRAHIAESVHNKTHQLLFRKSDSVVEKLFSKWLTVCLMEHFDGEPGQKYYTMYKALKSQTNRGPVDAVTGAARYSINEARLLREPTDDSHLDVHVLGLDGSGPYPVRLLACDTIGQAKAKVLEVVYRGSAHSARPQVNTFDLEWQCPSRGNQPLHEMEQSTLRTKHAPRLATIGSNKVPDQALLLMLPAGKRNESRGDSGQSSWSSLERTSPYPPSPDAWHLTPPNKGGTMKKGRLENSIPDQIPEVFLTRLLTSKGTVQSYIEEFLESALFLHDSHFPPVLKRVFDFLDDEAGRNGISDPSLLQQWKCNVYILRVWVQLLHQPRLLFDVAPDAAADANLPVVAQTLMDCFSSGQQPMGADSPSSRLLFAKEISRLRPLSTDLFKRIRRAPRVTEEQYIDELNAVANLLSSGGRTGCTMALSELLTWVRGNGIKLLEILSTDAVCLQQRLPQRFSQVVNLSLESEHIYADIA